MQKELNKKGQDLSIGTLILIVLGIVVLVLLILGFSLGWDNLWEKINIFGGSSSVGDVVTQCSLSITQANTYDYCNSFKSIKIDGKTEYLNCQDDRVQGSLSKTGLTCTGDPVAEFCKTKAGDQKFTNEVKVNQRTCQEWNAENAGPVRE